MLVQVPIRLTRAGLQKWLADALDDTVAGNHAGLLADAHVGLYAAAAAFTELKVLGDLTEATYDGYARKPVVWAAAGLDELGRPSVHGAGLLFSPTGAVTPNTIHGIILADALAAGNLYGMGVLPEPINLAGIEDDITIVPVFKMLLEAADYGLFSVTR